MQKPLQITIHGMEHSAALDAHIREKAAKLEEFYPRMTACHVTVEQPHRHRQQGAQFAVRIDVRVPGRGEVVVNRKQAEDVYVALRDAFDAAKRQLEECAAVGSSVARGRREPTGTAAPDRRRSR